MVRSGNAQQLLDRVTAILPDSDEDLIYKGVVTGVAEQMMALKKADARLQECYGSREALEQLVQTEGVSPDDHTHYTDLVEWRAIHYELSQLREILETL
jgi:hypothetical protein